LGDAEEGLLLFRVCALGSPLLFGGRLPRR
jgi:hypothetical protein